MTKQLAQFIARSGLGTFDETGTSGDIFIGTIPDQPDVAIAIFPTGGSAADLSEYNVGSYQLMIRTVPNDPRGGETTAQSIVDSLNGFNSDYFVDGGNWIVGVEAKQTIPNNIGQDEKSRFEYSQNFIIEYQK
jgi:hypothetical protein